MKLPQIGAPTKKSAVNAIALGTGAYTGVSISQGVESKLPNPETDKNKNLGIRIGTALLAFGLITTVKTNDTMSLSIKGALAGYGAKTLAGAMPILLKDSSIAQATATDGGTKRFIQGALGLNGCGCNTNNPMNRYAHLSSLNFAKPMATQVSQIVQQSPVEAESSLMR